MAILNELGHRVSRLSPGEMRAIIAGGGSVMIGNRVISNLNELPSAVVMAGKDKESREIAVKELDTQLDELFRQRQALLEGEQVDEAADEKPVQTGPVTRVTSIVDNEGETSADLLEQKRASYLDEVAQVGSPDETVNDLNIRQIINRLKRAGVEVAATTDEAVLRQLVVDRGLASPAPSA